MNVESVDKGADDGRQGLDTFAPLIISRAAGSDDLVCPKVSVASVRLLAVNSEVMMTVVTIL